ncbi:hypothetical protein pEaSNUABM29_00235 [Erwinia phage pEa_SNUABM_29]|nr:hypothetical protein pEaSNUABM29_00235 [Erwinia phage pEa_SNUABM_29]
MYFLSKQHRMETPGTWLFLWLLLPVVWIATAVQLYTGDPSKSIAAGLFSLMLAPCISALYASDAKDTWYDRCHLSGAELVSMRNQADSLLREKPKEQTFEQLVSIARSIRKADHPDFTYALLATIYIQEQRTSDYWVPKEAKKYIRRHPIENHIIRRAWNPL